MARGAFRTHRDSQNYCGRQAAFAQRGGGSGVVGRAVHERAQDRERFEAGSEQERGELVGEGFGVSGRSEHLCGLRK